MLTSLSPSLGVGNFWDAFQWLAFRVAVGYAMVPQLLWFPEKLVAAHFAVCAHLSVLCQSSPSELIHVPPKNQKWPQKINFKSCFVHLSGGAGIGTHMPGHMCGGHKTTCRNWLPFHHVGSRHGTQLIRIGNKHLCLVNHLAGQRAVSRLRSLSHGVWAERFPPSQEESAFPWGPYREEMEPASFNIL